MPTRGSIPTPNECKIPIKEKKFGPRNILVSIYSYRDPRLRVSYIHVFCGFAGFSTEPRQ